MGDEEPEETKSESEKPDPHKFVVNFSFEPRQEQFSDLFEYTKENELVTGTKTTMAMEFKNVGDFTFPSGEVSEFNMQYEHGFNAVGLKLRDSEKGPLPICEPGESFIHTIDLDEVTTPGSLTVEISLSSQDDRDVLFFDPEDEYIEGEKHFVSLLAADREKLRLLAELKGIKSRLGEK